MLVTLALYLWIPVVLAIFAMVPGRRALLISVLGGWMVLPVAGIALPGLPDLSKLSITSFAPFLGVLLFDSQRLTRFQIQWFDIPMVAWLLAPSVSAVANGFGLYDAISAFVVQLWTFGFPYLLGRIYFDDLDAMKVLAVAMIVAAIAYVPPILFELRMSPQLHNKIYGYHPVSFHMNLRFGGYRPTVLMGHGIMVGLFMTSAAMAACWLWRSRTQANLWSVPIWIIAIGLLIVAVLCRSMNAYGLMAMGMAALWLAPLLRTRLPIYLLLAIIPAYIIARTFGHWSGQGVTDLIEMVDANRAYSFDFRLRNEDNLVAQAMLKPLFGWRGYGMNTSGAASNAITDGFWVIVLGQNGFFGLITCFVSMLLPSLLVFLQIPLRAWSKPQTGPAIVLAVLPVLFMIDCLPNAMLNPLYIVIAGAMSGLAARAPQMARQLSSREMRSSVASRSLAGSTP